MEITPVLLSKKEKDLSSFSFFSRALVAVNLSAACMLMSHNRQQKPGLSPLIGLIYEPAKEITIAKKPHDKSSCGNFHSISL